MLSTLPPGTTLRTDVKPGPTFGSLDRVPAHCSHHSAQRSNAVPWVISLHRPAAGVAANLEDANDTQCWSCSGGAALVACAAPFLAFLAART